MRSYLRSRSAAVVMSVIVVSFCAAATVRADDPPYVTPGTGGPASASPETSRDMSRTANAWNTINGTITAVGQSTVDVTTDRGESFTFLTDEISNVPCATVPSARYTVSCTVVFTGLAAIPRPAPHEAISAINTGQ